MEILIICAGVLSFWIILLGFILLWRYLSYRETLALAEKGLVRPKRNGTGTGGHATLVWGIILAAIGLALSLGLWPLGLSGMGTDFPLGLGPWMLAGFLPLFFGLGLVLVYVLTRDKKSADDQLEGQPGSSNDPLDITGQ